MRRVAIVGLGLIGGSVGLALKNAKAVGLERVGFARRAEVASKAVSIGAVDRAEGDLISAVEDANLVIIATPPHGDKKDIGPDRGAPPSRLHRHRYCEHQGAGHEVGTGTVAAIG